MTNYSFRSHRSAQPVRSSDDTDTRRLRRKITQRKAERKEVLDRVRAQRARTYRQLVNKRKAV